jgi:hypothetical protein
MRRKLFNELQRYFRTKGRQTLKHFIPKKHFQRSTIASSLIPEGSGVGADLGPPGPTPVSFEVFRTYRVRQRYDGLAMNVTRQRLSHIWEKYT